MAPKTKISDETFAFIMSCSFPDKLKRVSQRIEDDISLFEKSVEQWLVITLIREDYDFGFDKDRESLHNILVAKMCWADPEDLDSLIFRALKEVNYIKRHKNCHLED